MSIGSSLSGINFSGLSSGIDTQSIVTRLVQLEQLPAQRLQFQRAQLEGKQSLFSALKGQLQNLASKAGALNSATAFSLVSVATSNDKVVTATAGEGAVAGSYNVATTALAQFQKVSSTAFTDTTTALGHSGELVINGKNVEILASDSLTAIAQKINGTGSGVTASVINGGTGNARLTLTSSKSGVANKITVANVNGGTLAQTLGLTTGAATIANPVTNGFASRAYASSTEKLSTLLGNPDRGTSSFEINGTTVNIDFANDTLQTLATKIAAVGGGVSASVESVTVNGTEQYRVKVTGASTPAFTDANSALEELGFLQSSWGNQLVAAQDAAFTIDGIAFTSATNQVTGILPGITLNLLKDDDSSVITLSQDNEGIKTKVNDFVEAYNSLVDFVKNNTKFDKDSFQAGALFGDSTTQLVESTLANSLFNNVVGLSANMDNLADIGMTFDSGGKLKLDSAELIEALAANPNAVSSLFRATGTTSTSGLSYVSGSSKTKASTAAGYGVDITQVATKSTATFALTAPPTTTSETITFNGSLFGNTAYAINVEAGSTVDSIVEKINTDSKLKSLVVASNEGGELKITSQKFGTPGRFTVAATGGGGEDSFVLTGTVDGLDIAGKINNEPATGSGQFLTGSAGNANTDGLQIMYTGTSTGLIGNLTVSIGVGAMVNNLVNTMTDGVSGLLKGNDDAIAAQIKQIDDSIVTISERAERKRASLLRRFTAMEEAISRIRQQGSQLSAIGGG